MDFGTPNPTIWVLGSSGYSRSLQGSLEGSMGDYTQPPPKQQKQQLNLNPKPLTPTPSPKQEATTEPKPYLHPKSSGSPKPSKLRPRLKFGCFNLAGTLGS